MLAKDIEMENLVYNTTEHRHYFRFFLKDDSIGCVVDFFYRTFGWTLFLQRYTGRRS